MEKQESMARGRREQGELWDNMKDNQRSKREKKYAWVFRCLVVCMAVAIFFTASYGYFRSKVEELRQLPLETEENAGWLYQNAYVLYRDLYNKKNQTQIDYLDLYLKIPYAGLWFNEEEEFGEIPELVQQSDSDWTIDSASYNELAEEVFTLKNVFQYMEDQSGILNKIYGYVILDNRTGDYVTNMSEAEIAALDRTDYYFKLSYVFDSAGNVTVGEQICAQNPDDLRKLAVQAPKNTLQVSSVLRSVWNGPVDCTVTYVVSGLEYNNFQQNRYESINIDKSYYSTGHGSYLQFYIADTVFRSIYSAYATVGVGSCLVILLFLLFVLGGLMPVGSAKPWQRGGACALPFEVLVGIGILGFSATGLVLEMVVATVSGQMSNVVNELLQINGSFFTTVLILSINVLVLTMYFFVAMYLGVCAKAFREMGVRGYIRERSLIYRLFPYVSGRLKKLYHFFTHMDLTKNSRRVIRRIVLVNAVILFVISATWLGGLGIVIVYSIILYFILKKYVSDIQRHYRILLKAVDEMAEGNLNVTIKEDLGIFEPFKPQIFKIQNGFKKAVEEEVRSQRMKAELITNVSHDLKTPLTAIITYLNLLKNPDLTEEQRQEYLAIMERKSLRLKVLIEDLFEVSKANSRNMTLDLMPIDIMNLVKQVSFEMQDKMDEASLDVRMTLTEEKISLSLDSQKTYRIYENLFANVAKYALKGTRVYVNGFRIDDTVVITIKNISEQELTVDPSELTERFVRGDASRNTEGSGLGLAIAKSFMEMQGGELELEVDGDLFKATTIWHVKGGQI